MCWNPLSNVPFTRLPVWYLCENEPALHRVRYSKISKQKTSIQTCPERENVRVSLSPHAVCKKHAWVPSPAQSAASMEAMKIISLTILLLSSHPVLHLPECQLNQALSALACQSTATHSTLAQLSTWLGAESHWESGSAWKRTWQNLWLLLSQKQAAQSKLPCS